MTHPPDWLNSVMFLLIGILAVIRKQPVKKEIVGGVAVSVQDPGLIDRCLRAWDAWTRIVLWMAGITLTAHFLWRAIAP